MKVFMWVEINSEAEGQGKNSSGKQQDEEAGSKRRREARDGRKHGRGKKCNLKLVSSPCRKRG